MKVEIKSFSIRDKKLCLEAITVPAKQLN